MRLFSNRLQKTSKCGKNISDTLGFASCGTFLFLPHFDVICDLLLNLLIIASLEKSRVQSGVNYKYLDPDIELKIIELAITLYQDF